jgi:hypothetical protein
MMPGITSLLKSAQAAQKKVRQQEDAIENYNWQSSAQTYDDFVNYSKYLKQRLSTASDVSEQLGYQTTLRSAQRSYTSNEIQRATQAVMSGNATTGDKMDTVRNLFKQAIANNDANLAQNLFSTWQTLSIQQQNEQAAALKQFQAAGKAASDAMVHDLTKGYEDVTLPTGQKVTPLAAIAQDFENTGGSSATWQAAQDTMEALRGIIIDKYNNATTQEEVTKLEDKYGKGLVNIDKELTISIGGKTLNAQDIVNAAANDKFNNPIYGLKAVRNDATGQNEYKLTENNVESIDYVRQIDPQGNEVYVPAQIRTDQNSLFFGSSDQGRGLDTQITNNGEVIGANDSKYNQQQAGQINAGSSRVNRDQSQTIGNRLKELGIIATQNGTTIKIKLPGENVERTATIQPDGSIRYFADNGQIAEVSLVDKNIGTDTNQIIQQKGVPRLVDPNENSDFGTTSAFGGQLSQASAQGVRYTNDILGRVPVNNVHINGNQPINVGNNFTGTGTAATSGLLQGASQTRQAIYLQQQEAAMQQQQQQATAQLQATATFNLNQTPVQQTTTKGVRKKQLAVAPAIATPRIVVADPAPTPKITSVGVAQPGRITSVGVL